MVARRFNRQPGMDTTGDRTGHLTEARPDQARPGQARPSQASRGDEGKEEEGGGLHTLLTPDGKKRGENAWLDDLLDYVVV